MLPPAQPARTLLRRALLRTAALALGITALTGCQIDMTSAQLRVVDASMDAGLIDLYQNNTGLAYNLRYNSLTSYVAMSPGTYTLSADKSGTRQVLAETTVRLLAGKQYTTITGNGLANLQQTVLVDQTTPAPAGQIALRLVDQAPHTGAVDVYLVAANGRSTGSSPIATNLTFGSVTAYINVPEGTYGIDVVPAGTVLTTSTTTLLTGAQTMYPSGGVRTAFILDQEVLGTHPSALTAGVSVLLANDTDPQ
jgi:hypothetical protein